MSEKYDLTTKIEINKHKMGEKTIEGICIGETLNGEISLTPYSDINCRGLWLEIGYNERGNGTPHESRLLQTMFYQGQLKKDLPVNHRFSFVIPPNGPITYKGTYVNFIWYIRVRIDIPFWFDKREEKEFTVLPKIQKYDDQD